MTKTQHYLIGVDVGGTKMMAVVFNERFRPVGRSRRKTRGKKDDVPMFTRLAQCIEEAIENAEIDRKQVWAIGVGWPGPMNPVRGFVVESVNIGWKDFPLGPRLSRKFGTAAFIDNDVNLGVYGEYHFGAARGGKHVFGIFPGTGIGGGILIDGKIYHGASGSAGEVGHLLLDPAGPLCGCGQRGCLEAFAGRLGISMQLSALVLRGQAPHLADDVGSDPRDIRSGQIAQAIKDGDRNVETVVRAEAARMGRSVASVVNLLSPDTVVLGGGLVEAMPEIYLDEVTRQVKRSAMPYLSRFVRVVTSKLGDDAVAMGAARMAQDRLDESKKAKR